MKFLLRRFGYLRQADTYNLLILNLVPVVVFRQYLTGAKSPSWDFLGDYLTNAISWWNLGTFFSPANYIPYAFSGYPAYLSAQSSAWYFPYAVLDRLNLIASYPLAILQVLTIIFGIIGFYFLAKSWNLNPPISLLLSLGFLFSPGFFTSASHIDIVRAWAFVPWMFLALKPQKTHSALSVVLIGLLGFQYLIGVYPGVIIASAYIFIIYIPLVIWIFKPDFIAYIKYQLMPLAAGLLLSLIKWLPFLFEERVFRGGNTVVVNQGIVSTLIYPYQTTILPNDITMRSLFIAPLILLSVLLIKKVNKTVFLFLIIVVVSIILGFDFNRSDPWQNSLPLLGESRFRTTDFKLFITLGILILGGIGIQQSIENGLKPLRAGFTSIIIFGYVVALNQMAKNSGLLFDVLIPGNLIARIVGSTLFIVLFILVVKNLFNFKITNFIIYGVFLIATVAVGWFWALQSPAVWLNDRVASESFYYGETSSAINKRVKDFQPTYRTERSGPKFPIPFPAELTFQTWNKAEIEKSFTLGGLVSLKGVTRYEEFIENAMIEEGYPYYQILRMPLSGWVVDREVANLATASCIYYQNCIKSIDELEIFDWQPDQFLVRLKGVDSGLLVINEVSWRGWQAEVCADSECSTLSVASEDSDKLVSVPINEDTTQVKFYYKQPFKLESWVGFWLGIAFLSLLAVFANRKSTVI